MQTENGDGSVRIGVVADIQHADKKYVRLPTNHLCGAQGFDPRFCFDSYYSQRHFVGNMTDDLFSLCGLLR